MATRSEDPSTLANHLEIYSTHIHLELNVDFETETLKGYATHNLRVQNSNVSQVIFDTRDLDIISVEHFETNTILPHEIGESTPLGQPLKVNLEALRSKLAFHVGDEFKLTIHYSTSPNSLGVKWLNPQQTEGKKHPYMFTQFQAIHCRSAIPCQDTPSRKVTYTAKMTVPSPLVAVMSAIGTPHPDDPQGFTFEQKIPVATYLIAFAVGKLESREIGVRSAVWAEAETVDLAAEEFSQTEDYLKTAEEILTPYQWGRYDILCLPGSFPYGGMENPCLTFVTPTLLAGDKSLTSVVAHEIAHSWTGNLVTNENWEHFWLNEGFTVFVERKIIGRLFGSQRADFDYLLGKSDLQDSVNHYGENHKFTCLVHHLGDTDPDDAFSSVPYEKGSQFLKYLEHEVGGAAIFEPFLRDWIIDNSLKSTNSDQFKTFFTSRFPNVNIDWECWFSTPGMPKFDITSILDDSLATKACDLANRWTSPAAFDINSFSSDDISGWFSDQTVYFLDKVRNIAPAGLAHERIEMMDNLYHFSSVKNSEIRSGWIALCLLSKYEKVFDNAVDFLTIQGRMKFIRPTYRLLAACGDNGRNLAVETFTRLRNNYHNIAARLVASDLKLNQ